MKNQVKHFEQVSQSFEHLYASHHVKTQSIYLCLIGVILLAIPLIYTVKIELSSQSRGVIKSLQHNNTITAPTFGQVLENRIYQDHYVAQGDTLVILNPASINENLLIQEQKIEELKASVRDLNQLVNLNAINEKPSLNTIYFKQSFLDFEQKYLTLQLEQEKSAHELEVGKQLLAHGSLSEVELNQRTYQLTHTNQRINNLFEQYKKQWANELVNTKTQLTQAQMTISKLNKERHQHFVLAPMNGVIIETLDLQPGNFIGQNQTIASISPDTSLMIETFISPKDIGFIYPGMPVKFQIDAFNYNLWGLAEGEVIYISDDITQIESQPMFRVRCSLKQEYLTLKNGYTGKLKKGMTLTTRFLIAKRTLYQLLYDQVEDWMNPKII